MSFRLVLLTITQVNEIIRLAEMNAANDIEMKILGHLKLTAISSTNLELHELEIAIAKLSGVAKCELTALMWLGQGRIGTDLSRWRKLFRSALEELINDLPDHLASNGSLHHDLRCGLEMIGRMGSLTPLPLS